MLHASSTVPAVPTSLLDLFVASSAAHSSRPAIWVEGQTSTYEEVHYAAKQLAGAMQAVRRGNDNGQSQCGLLVNRTPTAYTGVSRALTLLMPDVDEAQQWFARAPGRQA